MARRCRSWTGTKTGASSSPVPPDRFRSSAADGIRQWVGGARLSEATVSSRRKGRHRGDRDRVRRLRLRVPPSDLFAGETRHVRVLRSRGSSCCSRRPDSSIPDGLRQPAPGRLAGCGGPLLVLRRHPPAKLAPSVAGPPRDGPRRPDLLHVPGDGGVLTLDLVLEPARHRRRVVSRRRVGVARVVVTPRIRSPSWRRRRRPGRDFAAVGLADAATASASRPCSNYWGQAASPRQHDLVSWHPDWASAQEIVITAPTPSRAWCWTSPEPSRLRTGLPSASTIRRGEPASASCGSTCSLSPTSTISRSLHL